MLTYRLISLTCLKTEAIAKKKKLKKSEQYLHNNPSIQIKVFLRIFDQIGKIWPESQGKRNYFPIQVLKSTLDLGVSLLLAWLL